MAPEVCAVDKGSNSGRRRSWPWFRANWALVGFVVLIGALLWPSHSHGPSNKLYGQLVQIAKDTKLPPAGAPGYWYGLDVTAQVCPLVSRDLLTQMATEVGSQSVYPPLKGDKDDTWTVFTGSDFLHMCDRTTARAVQVRLSGLTGECHAEASITPACDP
jgi:hypothetical protein